MLTNFTIYNILFTGINKQLNNINQLKEYFRLEKGG